MTIQSAIDLLRATLASLIESVRELALAVDDVPEEADAPAIVDALRNWAADVEGDLEETAGAAQRTSANEETVDVRGTGRQLAQCHASLNAATRRFRSGLALPSTIVELQQIAAERAGSWERWSGIVQQAVERCDLAALDAADALLACWRETIDHAERRAA